MTTINLNFGLVATVDGDSVIIKGNTFANKDRLTALGAKWDREKKAWILGADVDLSSLKLQTPAGGCGQATEAPAPKTIGSITVTPGEDGLIYLNGETYPLRDKIKAHGGKWNAARKLWTVPAETSLDFLEPAPGFMATKPTGRAEWTCEQWDAWISDYKRRHCGRVVRCCEHAVDVADMYGPSKYMCPRHGETRGSYTGD